MQENGKSKDGKNESESLSDLIVWNITKALQKNPTMDLKTAMKTAEEHLEADMNLMLQQFPEERHLVCALLAWQQLGHSQVESLHKFFETVQQIPAENQDDESNCSSKEIIAAKEDSNSQNYPESQSFVSYSKGPVVRLPTSSQPKIVMRLDGTCSQRSCSTQKKKDTSSKLDAACCKDSECIKKLATLDKNTRELRSRAAKMAKRETNRVELLERAEAAWRDLEIGYQRRLSLAIEKEKDLTSQIEKLIDERNSYKNICSTLTADLNKKTELAENDKKELLAKDKEVCDQACVKLQMFKECTKAEAALADQQCKITQLERDLQLKEAQAVAKLQAQQSEVEATRGMSIETERVLRSELAGLREQVAAVSAELLLKDNATEQLKVQLEKLRQTKMNLLKEQEGCQSGCDNKIKAQLEEFNQKREKLQQLMEEAVECRCKFPVDATVEVKRTASLAALCNCTREDALSKSCSCTSVRERLISSLLKDLFGGLQDELGGNGQQMPCQLLKCLEDSHNWDKASVVKTNLRNYFSELLLGELDIAIATAIEKSHVRWVGECCVDAVKPRKRRDDHWEDSHMECNTHRSATSKMAGTSFCEKLDHPMQQTQEQFAPNSCLCKAAYPCLVNSRFPSVQPASLRPQRSASPPSMWKRTHNDMVHLKQQIEELKKDSIKKEDLKQMEQKITKIVQQASAVDSTMDITPIKEVIPQEIYINKGNNNNNMKSDTRDYNYDLPSKPTTKKRNVFDNNHLIKKRVKNGVAQKNTNSKINKYNKILPSTYAVNVCLCGSGKPQECPNKIQQDQVLRNQNHNERKQKISKENVNISQLSNVRQSKPINTISSVGDANSPFDKQQCCKSNCVCLNKKPSNTSLNKLLETLLKWKCDLTAQEDFSDEMPGITDHNKRVKSINNSDDYFSKLGINVDKSISFNNNVSHRGAEVIMENIKQDNIPATESEYLGAIYFDKSNECYCKCDERDTLHNKTEENSHINSSILLKYANVDPCNCKKSIEFEQAHDNCLPIPVTKSKSSKRVQISYFTNENLNKTYQDKETGIKDDIRMPTKKPDYHIKFLGVTLTDTSSHILDNIYIGACNRIPNKMEDEKCLHSNEYLTTDYGLASAIENHDSKNTDKLKQASTYKTPESCVCCVKNSESSKDLELNTFCLIKDHLKRKLEEFKTVSCKSYCIPPQEEESLFTDVIEKVKQVVTDTAKEIKCKCAGENTDTSGTWNRAFSLLQEYLKIKLQRVQCSCGSNDDAKENVLSDVTQKVCKLIEHDFERLKDICTCKNAEGSEIKEIANKEINEINVKPQNDFDNLHETEISGDSTGLNMVSKNNSAKSIILTVNISSQVPPGLGMDTKSCDAMSVRTKSVQATETYETNPNNSFKTLDYIPCSDAKNYGGSPFMGTQEVLVGLCTNSIPNYEDDARNVEKFKNKALKEQKSDLKIVQNIVLSKMDKITDKTNDSYIDRGKNIPYIGYTVDCPCDANLGACVCIKSIIQGNDDKINNIMNIYNAGKNNGKDLSYIMNSPQLKVESKSSLKSSSNVHDKLCQSEVNVHKSDEIIIKISHEKVADNFLNDITTNTIEEIVSMGTEYSNTEEPLDWYECSPSPRNDEVSYNNLKKSILFPPIEYSNVHNSKIEQVDKTLNDIRKKCDCNVVPICHVKMLVDNIESNLLNSRCTCDSMIPQVCPVHSKSD